MAFYSAIASSTFDVFDRSNGTTDSDDFDRIARACRWKSELAKDRTAGHGFTIPPCRAVTEPGSVTRTRTVQALLMSHCIAALVSLSTSGINE